MCFLALIQLCFVDFERGYIDTDAIAPRRRSFSSSNVVKLLIGALRDGNEITNVGGTLENLNQCIKELKRQQQRCLGECVVDRCVVAIKSQVMSVC